MGFAIPIDQVKITADQILRTGEARYPVIGATVDTAGQHRRRGAKILKVNSDSPAREAGLRKGDVVTEVAGEKVRRRDRADRGDPRPPARRHDAVHGAARGSSQMSLRITLGSQVG